jgi:serine/threonine protein kinase
VQIADALHVMHQCRVMHRDIKPANVFLTSAPSSASGAPAPINIVKLGDLGLGRYLSSKTYETFSMVGTPFYMSPESIANTGYHFKSDIWSCGTICARHATLRRHEQSRSSRLQCREEERVREPRGERYDDAR